MKFRIKADDKPKRYRSYLKPGEAFIVVTRDAHGRINDRSRPFINVVGAVLETELGKPKYWGLADDGYLYFHFGNTEVEIVELTIET